MARTNNGFKMNTQKLKTKLRNDVTFASYFGMLERMAEGTFKWEGLPLQIDPTFIEKMLFQYGMVAVFNEKVVGLVALPCMSAGGFDIYGQPSTVRAFSPRTGFSQLLKYSPDVELSECVLIHNTNRDINSALFRGTLGMYAERLTEMKRTEDINIFAQRTPVTVAVPEAQVTTYKNLLNDYECFGQTVVGYKGLNVDSIKAIKTDAPWIAEDVDELFVRTWNEAIGYLGISNVSIHKKERISNDEVARAMGGSLAFRNVRQEPRERAIELINAKWGMNCKVTFSEELFDLELFGNKTDDGVKIDD